ncbi:MAG: cytochrome [Acidimicrobiales bacterium]|nr:cytochrome [Acidimicrobiales bacterium]
MSERPTSADLTAPLTDEAFYAGDPFPHYARLRAEAPVAWHPDGWWAVSTHAEVLTVSRDPETYCSGKGILTMEIGVEYPSPPTMMHTDPPEHTRYRKLVQPGFAPSVIRALEAPLRASVAARLDAIEPGDAVDIVPALAEPFPVEVIADLLGVPAGDRGRFVAWSDASIPGSTDMTFDESMALMAEMHTYLLELGRDRRGRDGEDLITVLANVEVDGEVLSDDELVMFLNQLLVAGNETSRNMISGGLWALAERPEGWRRLQADRGLVRTAVEEFLRWTTPVVAFMRTATRDSELRGVAIAEGDPVLLLYASANRDEEAFGPTAGHFDVGRDPNHHVALGFGPHFCIGAALARLEGRVLLEEMLDRFATLEPAGDLVRTASPIIAGIKHAPIAFARSASAASLHDA